MKQSRNSTPFNRRHLLGGAGTAGALAAAAVLMPARQEAGETPVGKPAPEQGGGYQVTAHVMRYYQTAKV